MVMIFMPIISLLHQERMILSDRRLFSNKLHDELQKHLWTEFTSPQLYSKIIHSKHVVFDFSVEKGVLKGCIAWENARKNEETFCLYGITQ